MSRWLFGLILVSVCALLPTWEVVAASVPPVHSIAVSGTDVDMFPAFDPSVTRYAVTTSAATGGTVEVTADTSEPGGEVRVNGRPVAEDTVIVEGLSEGDEIAVFIDDSSGHSAYSLIYLPAEFPLLRKVTPASTDVADGHVLLTLGLWTQPSAFYETAVDDNGVPAHVFTSGSSLDFKPQPGGQYSVARSLGDGRGSEIVVLDEQLRELRRHRAVDKVNTDGHDFLLRDDGSAYLMSYEADQDSESDLIDAVIQHVGPDGDVLFEWNSADHVDPTAETVIPGNPDYAHINSFEVLPNGDLLVSFRHFSSIFRIAREAHDGFEQGEVIWKLGGRDSDFTFVDAAGAPEVGPCAQHTATRLPNGNFMAFDNGAWGVNPLCVDPEDPNGPAIARTPTRIIEWELDLQTGVATVVRDLQINDRYAIFAGSAQWLENGNTMIGWASAREEAMATEVNADGETVWELKAVESPSYFTYRAYRALFPDRIAPALDVNLPSEFELGEVATPSVECTDRGGSSLVTCDSGAVDTSTPGTRTFAVTATDGAGNTTTVSRTYTVIAPSPTPSPTETPTLTPASEQTQIPSSPPPAPAARFRPDLAIRHPGARSWLGDDRHDVRRGQVIRSYSRGSRVVARIRVQNDGSVADRFRVRLRAPQGAVQRPRWAARVRRSPLLDPAESWIFRLVVRRPTGDVDGMAVRAIARSLGDGTVRDRLWVRAVWR